ncbi:MAG: sigma-70 family RNA polymerase sigma factor [Candidatus Zixiibacteriota bacterium]
MSKEESNYFRSLVSRCLNGDQKAWEELIRRVSPIIHAICYKKRLSRDERYDILGQVILLLLKNLKNVKSPEKLIGYVATMTNREIRELTRKSNYLNHMHKFIVEEIYSRATPSPDFGMENTQDSEALLKAMAKLPRLCYELLRALFFDIEKPSYKELSQRLGIPVSSIGPTRERCLNKLHKLLDKK